MFNAFKKCIIAFLVGMVIFIAGLSQTESAFSKIGAEDTVLMQEILDEAGIGGAHKVKTCQHDKRLNEKPWWNKILDTRRAMREDALFPIPLAVVVRLADHWYTRGPPGQFA